MRKFPFQKQLDSMQCGANCLYTERKRIVIIEIKIKKEGVSVVFFDTPSFHSFFHLTPAEGSVSICE